MEQITVNPHSPLQTELDQKEKKRLCATTDRPAAVVLFPSRLRVLLPVQ